MSAPLQCQVDVSRVATANRAAHADMVLSVAVSEAAALIRSGNQYGAVIRLAQAEMSAARILGSTS